MRWCPAGNLSPWWFTKLHSFPPWVLETLAQRDLGVFGCTPRARWVGGSGDAVGQGCWREGPGEGSQWLCPPLSPQAVGFLCLPITFGMMFASGTASSQAADPTRPSPVPAMVPVSYKSWVGAKHGHEVAKTPAPDLHQSGTQASHCLSLTPTAPRCSGLTKPLIYEPSTWLVVWWLLF